MLITVVFSTCFLFLLSPSLTDAAVVVRPSLGPVYAVPGNSSLLNFTFVYPANFQFNQLLVNFTLYDFIDVKHDPQIYPSLTGNFSNSNTSLPWVIPSVVLVSGDYVIACFQWVQIDQTNQIIDNSRQCVLTRAALNSTIPPLAQTSVVTQAVTNNSISVVAYFPQALPYDVVNITANLNGVVAPTMTNATMNDTSTTMTMFSFQGLVTNAPYNVCVLIQYEHSEIAGSRQLDMSCQSIIAAEGNGSGAIPSTTGGSGPSTTISTTSGSGLSTTTSNTSDGYGSGATIFTALLIASTLIGTFI